MPKSLPRPTANFKTRKRGRKNNMTEEDAQRCLSTICEGIVQQNRELITGLDQSDFDPSTKLDNTKNNASYKLTDFFDSLKAFPYGKVPYKLTNEVVATTDELLEKIREKYGEHPKVLGEIIRVGQAFRKSKRIWRIQNPIDVIDQKEYKHLLDVALSDILKALDDLNYELTLIPINSPPSAAKLPRRKRGKQADWRKEDPAIIKRREDTKRVLAEIKKRHKAMGRSYTKIIDEMKQSSVWGARMKHMSIKTWKSRVCGN